jgi:hypothetical protein
MNITPAQNEFCKLLQIQLQRTLKSVIESNGTKAQKVDLALNHIAFSLGSATASTLYEFMQDILQKKRLDESQKELMDSYLVDMMDGFKEKAETILSSKEKTSK